MRPPRTYCSVRPADIRIPSETGDRFAKAPEIPKLEIVADKPDRPQVLFPTVGDD